MSQYRVSDAAKSDLDEIWFYIAQDNVDATGSIRLNALRLKVAAKVQSKKAQ